MGLLDFPQPSGLLASPQQQQPSGLLANYYDPNRSFAQNALDPRSLDQAMSVALGFGPGIFRAYHGSPNPIVGPFRPSTSGYLGPGVYASEQPGVAAMYGKVNPVDILTDNFFDATPKWMPSRDVASTRGDIFQHLTPEEQARVADWWPDKSTMSISNGQDIWETISRRLGSERAADVIKRMGYEGIKGIGDGGELTVFDPSHIQLAK